MSILPETVEWPEIECTKMRQLRPSLPSLMISLASATIGGGVAGTVGFKVGNSLGKSEVAELYERNILQANIESLKRGIETWQELCPDVGLEYQKSLEIFESMETNWPANLSIGVRVALVEMQGDPKLIETSVKQLRGITERAARGELSTCGVDDSD